MDVLRGVAWMTSGAAWRQLARACRDPRAAQENLWRRTLAILGQAPFWKDRLPSSRLGDCEITEYSTYLPQLERDYAATTSSLSGEAILFWAESSGTTGARKLFPITRAYRRQFQTVNLPFVHGLLRRFPDFLRRPVLYFTSIASQEKTPAGVPIGFISGYNYAHTPRLLARRYALPVEILRDGSTYQQWAPVYAAAADVSCVLAITPARVRLFAEEARARRAEIPRLLRDGAAVRAGLPGIAISGETVRRIEKALHAEPFTLKALWPRLEVVGCWKTAACRSQIPTIAPLLGHGPQLVDVMYSATEGWINVPLQNEQDGGPVHPGAVLCEFLEVGTPVRKENLQPLHTLEPGREYEIFVTNYMGLVRYRLHDVVRCTGRFHASPIIEFCQKVGRELMLGMIRISERQLLASSEGEGQGAACLFAPSPTGDQLILYTSADTALADSMRGRIQERLLDLNPYYKRDVLSGLLKPLQVARVPGAHPLWRDNALHAQTKPRIFVAHPISPDAPGG